MRENCRKLRCRKRILRNLKEQHFCTGDTQGTNKHAKWTSKKELREKLRKKLRKIAKNC